MPVLVLVEEQRDAALGISNLQLQSSDRYAGRSGEMATDIVGRVGIVGIAQKVGT